MKSYFSIILMMLTAMVFIYGCEKRSEPVQVETEKVSAPEPAPAAAESESATETIEQTTCPV
ncbi:MAG: hypothetical protein JW745_05205, partial [Sedimentisphaerales bacterium]|nr:hypothetical protein [Sedimentisphaerales bacterium]